MIKTNTRRRIVSVLLVLMILLSLMPGTAVPVHAFWDDYDDGFDCPNCDHYHFGSDYMCDCLFCTIDCNYECWVETHCNDCGVCFGDTPYWCEECYKCAECMEEKHCSTCAKCYIGEDDQLCGECHKGPCCSISICDTCGFCDDCANDDSDPMHCSLCNACFGAVDECVDDDDTGVIHCVDCHTACEQCEECLLNQESCEECGLCLECCRDNSDAGGCPDGETCVESAEWDEHICPGCDGWVTDKEDEDEFCETCELCKECCEGNSDCSEGMCAMDTDYADHFCEDCGLCALIIRLKLKTEDRANAKQAHHDKAIALQQPHSFSIKDCTSPYSYTFPYCSNNVPCKKSLFLYSLLTKAKINNILY